MYQRCSHGLWLSLIWALSSCWSVGAWAQIDGSEGERLLQQEQQRLEALRREQQALQRQVLKPEAKSEQEIRTDNNISCTQVERIVLKGIKRYKLSDFDPILKKFSQRCLTITDLNTLLRELTQHYTKAGYISSRAYLSPQDMAQGELQIQVIEGYIEAIIRADPAATKQSLMPAFMNRQGQLLNLRDLEQGLEQINRLRSRQATMELLPGVEAGTTRVSISDVQKSRLWQARLQSSNSGQASTGEIQHQLFVSVDNFFRLYDTGYFTLQSDDKSTPNTKQSRSASIHWDIPFGYWQFILDASYFEYLTVVKGTVGSFISHGTNGSQRMGLERLVHRDQNSKTRIKGSLHHKVSRNYIADTLITTSSRNLTIAGLSVEHEQYLSNKGLWVGELTYNRGLTLAEFDKYTISMDYQQPINIMGLNLSYRSRIQGQYSPDTLFSSEAISIGSSYSVRGYKESSVSGSTGVYWRNDWIYSWQPSWAGRWLNQLSALMGLDAGIVRDKNLNTDKYEKLKGWTVGMNMVGSHWNLSMNFSKPINAPKYFLQTGEQFDMSVSVTF